MSNYFQIDSGFTLVELLVTVATIGIMAAIGVSQMEEFRAKAHDASAAVAVKSLYTAMNAGKYQEAFRGNSGAGSFSVTFLRSGTQRGQGSVPNALNYSVEELFPGYVNNPDIRATSSFSKVINTPNNIQFYASVYHCKGSSEMVNIPESEEGDGSINPAYSYLSRKRFTISSQIGSSSTMTLPFSNCD